MPTVSVNCKTLYDQIGQQMTDKEFEDLCFDFGIELEETTTDDNNEKIYKIDIPANRYDMLCVEGIAHSLSVYLGLKSTIDYKLTTAKEKIIVHQSTEKVRPIVVGAILRNIKFDQERYNGFIELQDKLHNNICRKRTLVAIGTHDLDTVKGPFHYKALDPKLIKFKALNQQKETDGNELFQLLEQDRKLSKFLHIIKDEPLYPVIMDSQDRVLSLPPIINGDHSKISLNTKNVFIECTATDSTKALIVLNMIVTMFSRYCLNEFEIEPVEIQYVNKKVLTPVLDTKEMKCKIDYINSCVGIQVTGQQQVDLLRKMSLNATLQDGELLVKIPPTRADILHACDIMEDCAIAYNINKIKKTIPGANCVAVALPLNKLADHLRKELAYSGYTEVLSFTLVYLLIVFIGRKFQILEQKE